MKYVLIIIMLMTCCLQYNTYAQEQEVELLPKDKFIAGFMSWYMPGLGQFYAKEYTKGSIFVLYNLLQKAFLVGYIVSINNRYSSEDETVLSWNNLRAGDKVTIISYIGVYFFMKIYCIIDATRSVEKYNKRLERLKMGVEKSSSKKGTNYFLCYGIKF